jgi:flagellar basal-body rod protein FlgC
MFGSLDVSTSGLIASRVRMEAISANIANQDAIKNTDGQYEPFRRRIVSLATGDPSGGRNSELGVHVASIDLDDGPLRMKLEPESPFANADGYVGYPNVDLVTEQMNAMEAQRSYEANITAVEATKSMLTIALQMLA